MDAQYQQEPTPEQDQSLSARGTSFGTVLGFLGGSLTAAGLMYYFDPISGKRRRAVVRDKADHLFHVSKRTISTSARDLYHRLFGRVAIARQAILSELPSDDILVARVRANLGRHVLHSRQVEVASQDGTITLKGRCEESEIPELIESVAKVRGVKSVINQLRAHKPPEAQTATNPNVQTSSNEQRVVVNALRQPSERRRSKRTRHGGPTELSH